MFIQRESTHLPFHVRSVETIYILEFADVRPRYRPTNIVLRCAYAATPARRFLTQPPLRTVAHCCIGPLIYDHGRILFSLWTSRLSVALRNMAFV